MKCFLPIKPDVDMIFEESLLILYRDEWTGIECFNALRMEKER